MTTPITNPTGKASARVARERLRAGGLAGVLCLLATVPASAAIVTIDLTSAGTGGIDITGVNAGMTWEGPKTVVDGFVPGGDLDVFCGYSSTSGSSLRQLGLDGDGNLRFAHNDGSLAAPLKYTTGQTVDGTVDYSSSDSETMFYYTSSVDGPAHSVDFGPNSYMGFRFGNSTDGYRYGYVEVLWNWTGDPSTSTFQLLSAAYESTVGQGIVIPAPSAVPGAGLAGLSMAGLAGTWRRRRR